MPLTHYETRLRRVIDYIYDHADEDLSLDTLADVAAMSRFHWHRVFRAMTGETCAQAVRRVRLQRAGFMLVRAEDPIAEVARACGLGNQASFTRAFTEAYGISPARFRERGTLSPLTLRKQIEDQTMYDVTIENTPAHRVVAHLHQGDYAKIARAFEQLSALLTARNLWPQAKGMAGIYYDDPSTTPEADLRSHAGVVVAEDLPVPEGLEEVTLGASRTARLRLKGPYSGLPAAYDYLYGDWLPKSGEEPADAPAYEIYLNNPMDTTPEDLVTDIHVPLKG